MPDVAAVTLYHHTNHRMLPGCRPDNAGREPAGWVGDIVRGQVTRGIDVPPTWSASCNGTELGSYPSREEAMARVEEAVVFSMGMVLEDWSIFRPQAKRSGS